MVVSVGCWHDTEIIILWFDTERLVTKKKKKKQDAQEKKNIGYFVSGNFCILVCVRENFFAVRLFSSAEFWFEALEFVWRWHTCAPLSLINKSLLRFLIQSVFRSNGVKKKRQKKRKCRDFVSWSITFSVIVSLLVSRMLVRCLHDLIYIYFWVCVS